MDEILQILAGYVFHCDEVYPLPFAHVEHLTDVLMPDLPGESEFILESFDGFCIRGNFWVDDFQGDLFSDLLVFNAVDLPHPATSQLLDDFIPVSEKGPPSEFLIGCLEGFSEGGGCLFSLDQLCPAFFAEFRIRWIIVFALRTQHLSVL